MRGAALSLLDRLFGRAPSARALDASGGGRRWADARTAPTAGVIHSGAALIGDRAQHFALNTPVGTRLVESAVGLLIGTGITPRAQHPGAEQRARLQRDFARLADEADADGLADLYGLMSEFARDLVVRGEFLGLLTADPATGAPQLRRLHCEQLDRSITRRTEAGGWIIQGVEFAPGGKVAAYHIRPALPADPLAGMALAPLRVPASDVVHGFRRLMAGQVRGISWLAPVLLTGKELDALFDAMLMRAKIAALHAGFILDAEGAAPYDGSQDGAALEVSLEPGSMPVLPPGKAIEFFPLPDQGGAASLMAAQLRLVASGAGVTYEALTGDYSQVNYSSARMAKMDLRPFVEQVQHHVMVHRLCRPYWRRFIRWQIMQGRISAAAYLADPAAYDVAKWLPPAWPWIDPAAEAKAAKIALDARLRSRSEIIAERGYDAEDVDAEIAADEQRLKALGIAPVPVVGKVEGAQ